jgi:flagellum-specific peptidoglycan hydrolase FlgJ
VLLFSKTSAAVAAAVVVAGAVVVARHHDQADASSPPAGAVVAGHPLGRDRVLTELRREATRVHQATGIPAAAILGQAILESDMGQGRLPREVNNYFGIRCHRAPGKAPDPGPVAVGCATYRDAGKPAPFRTYRTLADSVTDYGRLITTYPPYRPALAHLRDVHAYLVAVAAAGYAGDPAYVRHVEAVITRYHLT